MKNRLTKVSAPVAMIPPRDPAMDLGFAHGLGRFSFLRALSTRARQAQPSR